MTFGYFLNYVILPIIESIKNWVIQLSDFMINNWIFKIIIYWELFIVVYIILKWVIELVIYRFTPKEQDKGD